MLALCDNFELPDREYLEMHLDRLRAQVRERERERECRCKLKQNF